MTGLDVIREIADGLLAQNPDPAVRTRLLRGVLDRLGDDRDLEQARQALAKSHWVRELEAEQWEDGSWGRLHSQDYSAKQKVPTTEAGVERALALGLGAGHPVLWKAARYLEGVVEGAIRCRDRPEKNDRWPTGVQLFAAAILAQIQPDLLALDAVWELWLEIARRTFSSGSYDAEAEVRAHHDLTGATVKDSYLVIDNRYALRLLSSRATDLPRDLEAALLDWVWHGADGVRYLGQTMSRPPEPAKAGPLDRWFASLELLSRFPSWRRLAQDVVQWLWDRRTIDGMWDLGPRPASCVARPLSESWRRKGARKADWTTRVLLLLRRYHDCVSSDDVLTLSGELVSIPGEPTPAGAEADEGLCYIIRKIRLAHCKKGPSLCAKCREMDVERICLLDICPPRAGEIQRRVIPIIRDGEQVWREFDISRMFASEEEATQYAEEHGITDVEF